MSDNIGRVVQVIGSTLDAEFPEGELPQIYHALTLEFEVMGEKKRLVSEVQQHLGGTVSVLLRWHLRTASNAALRSSIPERQLPYRSVKRRWGGFLTSWVMSLTIKGRSR